MKHLFWINSHSTFLTAIGTINYLGLKDDEVAMVLVRNYKNSISKDSYIKLDMSWAYNISLIHNLFRYNSIIRKIDNEIAELVGNDDFLLYAPSPGGVRILQILFTNSSCVGMNYLQEGALVFGKLFERRKLPLVYQIYDIFLALFYKHRLWSSHFSWTVPDFLIKSRTTPETFAISDDIFSKSGLKCHIIKWPKYDISGTEYEINAVYPCFVFESSVEMKMVEKDIYMELVKQLILENAGSMSYVKFHPYQSDENKQIILGFFKEMGKAYIELSMGFPFEIYLSSYSHLKVCGFNSSLLVYARQLGHHTVSMEKELLKRSAKYKRWSENRM